MPARYVVDYIDGWLCVKFADTRFDEPSLIEHWYPIERTWRAIWVENLLGRPAEHTDRGFRVFTEFGTPVYLQCPDGGKQLPIRSTETPVPCPKVRRGIETRWRDGSWQKYLKTAGWVPA